MINFIIYSINGKIVRVGSCQNEFLLQQVLNPDELVLSGTANYLTQYVVDGVVTERPTQSTELDKSTLTANGVDVINITGAPTGTFTATNTTTRETVTGSISGSDTFSTTVAGTYEIKIESFPYLDFVTTVEAI